MVKERSARAWLRSRMWMASFFFQAEDGIRDYKVTGVQTCALPIFSVAAKGQVAAREELLAQFNQGALLVDFIGHGSIDIWSSGGLFAGSDAASLHNEGRLPFVVAMTCLNGYFQDAFETSLAQDLLGAPGGGAVGVFASSSL